MFNSIVKYIDKKRRLHQTVPLFLTVLILIDLILVLYVTIILLNGIGFEEKIALKIYPLDILVGMTIYLKTSIDFAIFIGRMMHKNPGWKNRIAIEIGTAIGNGVGTLLVLIIWVFVKNVEILLAGMIFLASLVLFELAYDGVEHFSKWKNNDGIKKTLYHLIEFPLKQILRVIKPVLGRLIPNIGSHLKGESLRSWRSLLIFSFGIPFILGLDDFAGYVPLFNVINVFSFAIGVLAGHTLLNIALFLNPDITTRLVKNEWISYFGSIAFVGIAVYGFIEIARMLGHL